MREIRSNFQIIWTSEQLSTKKTNSWSVKMFTVNALFWPDLSFLPRATQMSKYVEFWGAPRASNYLPPQKSWNFLNFSSICFEFFSEREHLSPGSDADFRISFHFFLSFYFSAKWVNFCFQISECFSPNPWTLF